MPIGPNQHWVADITYIAITAGFVLLAAVLERAVEPPSGRRCAALARGTAIGIVEAPPAVALLVCNAVCRRLEARGSAVLIEREKLKRDTDPSIEADKLTDCRGACLFVIQKRCGHDRPKS